MDLPAEIRNRIYEIALLRDERDMDYRTYVFSQRSTLYKSLKTAFKQPALTRVSKAVRHESLPIFYGRNTFTVNLVSIRRNMIMGWLESIGATNRTMLKNCRTWCRELDHRTILKNYRSWHWELDHRTAMLRTHPELDVQRQFDESGMMAVVGKVAVYPGCGDWGFASITFS